MRLPTLADPSKTLMVSEVFGPTLQGEGPSTGQRAMFVRLSGCNLKCQWCDTPWTWDSSRFDLRAEQHPMATEAIISQLAPKSVDLVVVTGGEPLLQQHGLVPFVERIRLDGIAPRVEVETSGTIVPRPELISAVTAFNVSPKLAHSGMRSHQRMRQSVLAEFNRSGKAIFKFVVQDPSQLVEVRGIVDELALNPIWIMPEGTDSATVLARMRILAEPVIEQGWNLATRLHVLLWGDERGR